MRFKLALLKDGALIVVEKPDKISTTRRYPIKTYKLPKWVTWIAT